MLWGTLWLLLAFAVIAHFWTLRGISERAFTLANQYCDKHNLQFISLARIKTRPAWSRGKLTWYNEYAFEFSGNGEDASIGHLILIGHQLKDITMPAYRI